MIYLKSEGSWRRRECRGDEIELEVADVLRHFYAKECIYRTSGNYMWSLDHWTCPVYHEISKGCLESGRNFILLENSSLINSYCSVILYGILLPIMDFKIRAQMAAGDCTWYNKDSAISITVVTTSNSTIYQFENITHHMSAVNFYIICIISTAYE